MRRQHQGIGGTEAGRHCEQLQGLGKAPSGFRSAAHLKTQHAAELAHLAARQLVVRVRDQAGIPDLADGRMGEQEFGNPLGAGRLFAVADEISLQATLHQESRVRIEHRAEQREIAPHPADELRAANDGAAHDIAVPGRELRQAVQVQVDVIPAGPHQHGGYDIDLYLHSLTKFAAGHGDVMGGAVIGSAELVGRMRRDFTLLGAVLDPHAAFLVQRGLKTYFVRYREQSASTQRIAEFLLTHPAVSQVRYPGLVSHPHHELARRQMSEFGSVLSFEVRGGAEAAGRFAEALQLFAMAASLGATDSLVLPPQMIGTRDLSPEQLRLSGISPGTVRLSIGLEDSADLLADLVQALAAAA